MEKKVEIECQTEMERYDRQLYHLKAITRKLVEFVNDKDIQYGSSWRKRGGAGAFFTIIRKLDRFEKSCQNENFDVFKCFATDNRKESILDDCLDITGYMLLLIEHMIEIGHVTKIKELNMSFSLMTRDYDPTTKVATITGMDEPGRTYTREELLAMPSGMKNPHGFDEEEDVPK